MAKAFEAINYYKKKKKKKNQCFIFLNPSLVFSAQIHDDKICERAITQACLFVDQVENLEIKPKEMNVNLFVMTNWEITALNNNKPQSYEYHPQLLY